MRWLEVNFIAKCHWRSFTRSISCVLTILCIFSQSLAHAGDNRQLPLYGGGSAEECLTLGSVISDFETLASNGNIQAAFCLGRTHDIPGFKELGIRWLNRAVELGSLEAQHELAQVLFKKNRKLAVALMVDGAMRGDKKFQWMFAQELFSAWKRSDNRDHIAKAWAWLELSEFGWVADHHAKPARTLNLNDIMSDYQLKLAKEEMSEIKAHMAEYPQEPPKMDPQIGFVVPEVLSALD